MKLNDAGKMIEKWYFELSNKFTDIKCVDHVIMPNHIHFIIHNVGIVGADPCVCPNKKGEHTGRGEPVCSPLQNVIQWFKTMTTNEYIRHVKHDGWKPFNGKLWQRNYYEHIIRNEIELNRIREYILNNPLKWESDEEYVPKYLDGRNRHEQKARGMV